MAKKKADATDIAAKAIASKDDATTSGLCSEGASPDSKKRVDVIILAHEGTESLLAEAWHGKLSDAQEEVQTSRPLREVIKDAMCRNDVAERFVIIPASCTTMRSVTFAELCMPTVYVYANGRREYNHLLPKMFDKATLVDYLSADGAEAASDEEFAMRYATQSYGHILEVSHGFGNYVLMVKSTSPDVEAVRTASNGKRYIVCTEAANYKIVHKAMRV